MISFLEGDVAERSGTRVVISVGGVGYDVPVPASILAKLPPVGRPARVYTRLVVRDDAMTLFGFANVDERELFDLLVTVSGIGPKVALAVLSGIEPQDLIRAIERGDLARLTAIPGVGKKTSERIVLELKDRLPRVQTAVPAAGTSAPDAPVMRDDVVSALVNLGYHRPLAEKAAEAAVTIVGSSSDASFERVLKQALREVAK